MTHDTFALHDHKMWRLYYFITKFNLKYGLLAQNYPWGIPFPTPGLNNLARETCTNPIGTIGE